MLLDAAHVWIKEIRDHAVIAHCMDIIDIVSREEIILEIILNIIIEKR